MIRPRTIVSEHPASIRDPASPMNVFKTPRFLVLYLLAYCKTKYPV